MDTQLNKPTHQNSIKFPKVVKPINKKTLLQNFGDEMTSLQLTLLIEYCAPNKKGKRKNTKILNVQLILDEDKSCLI